MEIVRIIKTSERFQVQQTALKAKMQYRWRCYDLGLEGDMGDAGAGEVRYWDVWRSWGRRGGEEEVVGWGGRWDKSGG